MAFETLPGPELYDASTRSQSPKVRYRLARYSAAADVDLMGSMRSSTYELTSRPCIFPVANINCQSPVAPMWDRALGFKVDSTMARYLISKGISIRSRCCSNMGK